MGDADQQPLLERRLRQTGFDSPVLGSDRPIQELYGLLVADDKRNEQIIDDVLLAMEEGRSPILLTERKDHLEHLHERLEGFVRHILALRGGRPAKQRREIQERLASIPMDEERETLRFSWEIPQNRISQMNRR